MREGFARGDAWAPGLRTAHATANCRAAAPADRVIGARPDRAARQRRASARRGRHRHAVSSARRGIRRRLRRGRRFAPERQRRHGRLRRQPQHQLHQHLQLRLHVLRLLQGQARRQPARPGLRSRSRRDRAPRPRGLGSRRDRSLHAGRHPSALHRRRPISRSCAPRSAPCRDIHVHAFSPLEVQHGAATPRARASAAISTGCAARGSAACPAPPRKSSTTRCAPYSAPTSCRPREWLAVVETAHRRGLRTTATIMFGHVDRPRALGAASAAHPRPAGAHRRLHRVRAAAVRAHGGADLSARAARRKGPTLREAVLMHAVARLVLHPLIPNIQVSWVKLGPDGAAACLDAGANDLGGTLMNESISRAAGTEHGQEFAPERMDALIALARPRAAPAHHALCRRAGRTPARVVSGAAPGAARSTSAPRAARAGACGLTACSREAAKSQHRRARRHRQGGRRPRAALGQCRPRVVIGSRTRERARQTRRRRSTPRIGVDARERRRQSRRGAQAATSSC